MIIQATEDFLKHSALKQMASEEAQTSALMQELITGVKLMESREQIRETAASQVAQSFKGKGNKTMKHLMEVPMEEFVRVGQKYGFEAWHDRGFVRDSQRFNPNLSSNKA
jgi:hypothetical protein